MVALALLAAAASPQAMSATARTLASVPFEGRAPGTEGERKTVDYLVSRLKALGLEPAGPGGAWTQDVRLVRTQIGDGSTGVRANGRAMPLAQGRDVYLGTVRPVDRVVIAGAQMVFVGYGVHAPERGWDDFKGVDLTGKVAVFLVNDPDFEAGASEAVAGRFGGRRMTYYGRWTYKYEEAARRGAVAALIVHDTPGAGYPWSTVTAPRGENYDIAGAGGRVPLQGWIEGEAATAVFRSAGLNLAALRVAARRPDFRPVPLPGTTFSVDLAVAHSAVASHNVLAKLPGGSRPDEVVMYGAHWDAYGKGADGAIRPGANDDGLGVAGLFEIARAFKAGPRPDRTVAFSFWTAEERGLLGSEAYASAPVFPAAKTVANITPRHPADRRRVARCDAGRPGAERPGSGAGQSGARTGANRHARNIAGARVVLSRGPFLVRQAGGPDLVVHGDQRRARSCRGWTPGGRGVVEELHGLLPPGLRCMVADLGLAWGSAGRRPCLRGRSRPRFFDRVAEMERRVGVQGRARGERGTGQSTLRHSRAASFTLRDSPGTSSSWRNAVNRPRSPR